MNDGNTKRSIISSLTYAVGRSWNIDRVYVVSHFGRSLFKVLIPFISMFLPRLIINYLTEPGSDLSTMLAMLAYLAGSLMFANVMVSITDAYISSKAAQVRSNFLLSINTKALQLDYEIMESPDGQIARQKAYGATRSQSSGAQTVVNDLAAMFAHAMGFLLYATVTAWLHPLLVLALFASTLIISWSVSKAQAFEASQRNDMANVERKLEYMQETALNYRYGKDMRIYRSIDWFERMFNEKLEHYLAILHKVFKSYFSSDLLATLLDMLRDGVVYYYLIYNLLVDTGMSISLGDFTLYLAAIAGISNWITLTVNDYNSLRRGCMDIGYLRDYLDLEAAETQETNTFDHALPKQPEIVFENVSFRYPNSESWSLRNFDFIIGAGEKIALVGINGAGKTTCVKLLTGLYRPTEGRILINGQDLNHLTRQECFNFFSVVFQEAMPLAMSIRENIALEPPELINEPKVLECLTLAGLDERIQGLSDGLDTQLTRFLFEEGIELSGGQAQKLMLARALYKTAPIIVMDEPTAALDPIAEAEMYERYDKMVGQKTSLYISHRLASTRFCDRIIYLEDGKLLETGSHAELMASGGKYADMYAIQSRYYQKDFEGGDPQDV